MTAPTETLSLISKSFLFPSVTYLRFEFIFIRHKPPLSIVGGKNFPQVNAVLPHTVPDGPAAYIIKKRGKCQKRIGGRSSDSSVDIWKNLV